MRKPVALVASAAFLAALVGFAMPADAATCANGDLTCTGVTFSVSTGTVSLTTTTPSITGGTATLSGTAATLDIPLSSTTVTDNRSPTTGWSVSATASDFTSGGNTITKSNAAFSVPVDATWTTCTGTKIRLATATASVNGTVAAMIGCTQISPSGATYTPHLTMTVPAASVAGTYTGTVTQSVS